MSKQLLVRSVLLAALALPAFAQDPAPKTAVTAAQGPVLVVKTARMDLASMMAMSFEHEADLPDLADKAHFVMTLGADRKLKVETGAGDVGLAEITADPGALMELFAEQVEMARPMLRGTLTLALQPQGYAPKDVAVFVDELFAFPRQIRSMSMKVIGDPENIREAGLDYAMAFEPKSGSAFATIVEALQPCSQGAPMLAGGAGPAIQMQGSLAPQSMEKIFGPFLGLIVRITNQGAEEQQKAAVLYDRMMKLYDGGFSASFDLPFCGNMLVGMLDGAAAQQLLDSEEYLAVMKSQKMANRDMQMEITPNALEHRGTKMLRSRMTNDGAPNPVMPDGVIDTLFGMAGNYFAGTIGGKEQDAKALIDAIADQKVKREPLAGGAVLHLAVDFAAMMAVMQGGAGRPPSDEMPEKFTLTVGKSDKALSMRIFIK